MFEKVLARIIPFAQVMFWFAVIVIMFIVCAVLLVAFVEVMQEKSAKKKFQLVCYNLGVTTILTGEKPVTFKEAKNKLRDVKVHFSGTPQVFHFANCIVRLKKVGGCEAAHEIYFIQEIL